MYKVARCGLKHDIPTRDTRDKWGISSRDTQDNGTSLLEKPATTM